MCDRSVLEKYFFLGLKNLLGAVFETSKKDFSSVNLPNGSLAKHIINNAV